MRAMLVLVVGMGVLIVVGVATVAITIVGRMGHAPVMSARMLDQPPGTRIVSASQVGGQMALVLQGGGADRVVLVPVGPLQLRQ